MKMMHYAFSVLAGLAVLAGCQTEKDAMEKHHFDNKLYINTGVAAEEILVKAGDAEVVRTLSIGTALPVEEAIGGVFVADQAYVEN